MPARLIDALASSSSPPSRTTPITAHPVATNHGRDGSRRVTSHSSSPVSAGAAPSATTVPTATPLERTPAKNVGWYASTAAPPSSTTPGDSLGTATRTGARRAVHHATAASRLPPATIRVNPTAVVDAASGPYACAVPVVPKHTAAAMTSRTGRTPYC